MDVGLFGGGCTCMHVALSSNPISNGTVLLKRLFMAHVAHFHVFWMWMHCNSYYSTLVHLTFIERHIVPLNIIEWDIGPLNIIAWDIGLLTFTFHLICHGICMGYWLIEHIVLNCILCGIVHLRTHFTQYRIQLTWARHLPYCLGRRPGCRPINIFLINVRVITATKYAKLK